MAKKKEEEVPDAYASPSMKKHNLSLWDDVSQTNPAHTKAVKFGRSITAIDPYRQIQAATAQFGPAGIGWGWEVKRVEVFETKEVAVLVRVWIEGGGAIEQWGQNGLYIDAAMKKKDVDHMKKATTDGITKCLSCMCFNADVFFGKFDDNKYVQSMKQKFDREEAQADAGKLSAIKAMIKTMVAESDVTLEEVTAYLITIKYGFDEMNVTKAQYIADNFDKVISKIKEKK